MIDKVPEILLIEDDLFTSRLIKKHFEKKGIVVHQAFDVAAGYNKILEYNVQGIILDLSFPSGFSIDSIVDFKRVISCPIIVYTSNKQVEIELKTLDLGVSDFLMKERGINVLYNRLIRLIENYNLQSISHEDLKQPHQEGVLAFEQYSINMNSLHIILNNGEKLKLTKKEAYLLYYLAKKKNQLVGRDELSYVIKGYSHDGWSRSIDLIICRLRSKLEKELGNLIKIDTVRGKGYMLSDSVD